MSAGAPWVDSVALRSEAGVACRVTALSLYPAGSYVPMLLPRQLHQGLALFMPLSTAQLQLSRLPGSRKSDEQETQLLRAHHGSPSQPANQLITLNAAIDWLTDIGCYSVAQQLSSIRLESERVAAAAAAAQQQQEHSPDSQQQPQPRVPRLPAILEPPAATEPVTQHQPLVISQPTPQLQPGWVAAVRRVSPVSVICQAPAECKPSLRSVPFSSAGAEHCPAQCTVLSVQSNS